MKAINTLCKYNKAAMSERVFKGEGEACCGIVNAAVLVDGEGHSSLSILNVSPLQLTTFFTGKRQ